MEKPLLHRAQSPTHPPTLKRVGAPRMLSASQRAPSSCRHVCPGPHPAHFSHPAIAFSWVPLPGPSKANPGSSRPREANQVWSESGWRCAERSSPSPGGPRGFRSTAAHHILLKRGQLGSKSWVSGSQLGLLRARGLQAR